VRRLWTSREVDAPAPAVWELLVDLDAWPAWGPTVRRGSLDEGPLRAGATGRVETLGGLTLSFEVTAFEPGRRWAWKVAGVGATDHLVEPLGDDRCRAAFGLPWPAAPYAAVCRVALHRLDRLATAGRPAASRHRRPAIGC
jgi:hypothetical protein